MRRPLFDFKHPFFEPLWRRIAVVAVSLGWGGFEFLNGAPLWGVIFVGFGAVAAYHFFAAPS